VKSHSVEIAGQKLSIRSDATEAHMRRLTDLVNAQIKAVRATVPSAPLTTTLMLAAFQVADQLCELEDHVVRERREVAAEVRRVGKCLDESASCAGKWLETLAAAEREKPAGKDRA